MKKREYGTVSLPMPLIELVKEKIKGTGMHSVSAYVTFVLRQIFSSPEIEEKNVLDKKTEEEIKDRLKKLGYI
ncbi:Uncharacterised protein [uncultured archaeon]|nr:Uncharacterised protein [uncultured archaeon]